MASAVELASAVVAERRERVREALAAFCDRYLGELPLAEALALFEEGIQRLRSAHEALQGAEGTVRTLVEQAGGLLEVRDGVGG